MKNQGRSIRSKLGTRRPRPTLQVYSNISELAEKIRDLAEELCFLEPDLLVCAAHINAIEKVEQGQARTPQF